MKAKKQLPSTGGLWLIALNSLDPSLEKGLVGALKDGNGDILSNILGEAEAKKKLCLQKRWKVELRGRTIVLRDLFDKLIAWVNRFGAIADAAVQFDPTNAALPWAGVRFLLNVAMNDSHCFEATIVGLETVSRMIARYVAFESIYLQRTSAVKSQLQDGIVHLYTRMLAFLANSIRYFDQSTAKRLAKSVFQTTQFEEIDQIAKLDGEVTKLADISDAETQHHMSVQMDQSVKILAALRCPILRLVDAATIYTKSLEEDRFRAIVSWLSSMPYTQHQKRHSENRIPSTGQWLLRHAQFREWVESSYSSVFLLHGIPGSGKTCLTSAVVDHFLHERDINSLSAPLAYFFCGDSRFGRAWADPDEVMRSLLRQFAIFDRTNLRIHETVTLEYARREAEAKVDGFEMPRLGAKECTDLILSILGANPAVIVIDGVDEVEEHRRHELLDALIRIRDESASVVKVFLSSRVNNNVMAGLPDASILRVQGEDTHGDMKTFVEQCVSTCVSRRNLLDGHVSGELRHEINQFLLSRAGEMFLWVQLQVELLCKLKSAGSVSEALNAAPKRSPTIDHLYSGILEKLAQEDPAAYRTTTQAFSWLLCMREPLSTGAFLDAVSSSETSGQNLSLSEILSLCSNLIIVDRQLDTLRFAHVSFKEFLEARPEYNPASAHKVAAMSCLKTCIDRLPIEIENPPLAYQNYSMYAALYWGQHYAASNAVDSDEAQNKLVEFIFSDDGLAFQFWLDAASEASDLLSDGHGLKKELPTGVSESQTPFFTACIYGLRPIFDACIQSPDFDIDATNKFGHTGVYLAASFGHHELVQSLLELGADLSVQQGRWEDPLSAACVGGHFRGASLLLSQAVYSDSTRVEPALKLCFSMGKEPLALLLLERYLQTSSKDPSSQQNNYNWLSQAAAQAGFCEVMDRLIQSQAGDKSAAKNNSKMSMAAIRSGRLPFVRKLLEKRSLPPHAIAIAALFGQPEIIEWFLAGGYGIEVEGPFGTPLRCASLMGHNDTVVNLLSRGADINAVTPLGDALQAAAMQGHLSITNVLLQSKAKIQNSGGYFGTALQAAAYRGHIDVIEALLTAGASIETGGRFRSAFQAAAAGGQDAVIDHFLQTGYDFPQEYHFATPSQPCSAGFPGVPVRLSGHGRSVLSGPLRKFGEDDRSDSHNGKTQDMVVSSFEDIFDATEAGLFSGEEIIESAYGNRPDPDVVFRPGATEETKYLSAMELATSKGHLNVLHSLVTNSPGLERLTSDLKLSLEAACRNCRTSAVTMITSAGVDLRKYLCDALRIAASRGYLEIMDILIQHEAEWTFPKQGDIEQVSFDGHVKFPHTLEIVAAGCTGGQLASVQKGFRLATQTEVEQVVHRGLLQTIPMRDHQPEIFDFLLQRDISFSPVTLSEVLQVATQMGSKSTLDALLDRYGAEEILQQNFFSCWKKALRANNVAMLEYMLSRWLNSWSSGMLQMTFIYASGRGWLSFMVSLAGTIQHLETYRLALTEALIAACVEGKVKNAEWLINAGADASEIVEERIPSCRFYPGYQSWPSPAFEACQRSELLSSPQTTRSAFQACLKSILLSRSNEATRSLGSTFYLLVSHGVDVNQALKDQTTALHVAIWESNDGMVSKLIDQGADLNVCVSSKGTPLQFALKVEDAPSQFNSPIKMNASIVRLLLDSGAIVEPTKDAPDPWEYALNSVLPFYACSRESCGRFSECECFEQDLSTGPGAVIKHVLLSQPNIRATRREFTLLLQVAAVNGDLEYLELLLNRGTDVNFRGHYYGCALQAAARFGHLECVRLLLDTNANANLEAGVHGLPLNAAFIGQHYQVADLLIARGADPTFNPCRLEKIGRRLHFDEKFSDKLHSKSRLWRSLSFKLSP
ncbi:hypothetical protein N7512_004894 [Penicillium capsulatum]|nr:hypothetical protein N7512_004894 [Penicillium capsulatum]